MNKCPDCSYEYNLEYEGGCPVCGRDPYILTNGELEGEGIEK